MVGEPRTVRSRNIVAVTGLVIMLMSGATPAFAGDVPVSDEAAPITESAPAAYSSTPGAGHTYYANVHTAEAELACGN